MTGPGTESSNRPMDGGIPDNVVALREAVEIARRNYSRIFARGDHVELGSALLDRLTIEREHLVFCEGSMWIYKETSGIWSMVDVSDLRNIVVGFAGMPVNRGKDRTESIRISKGTIEGATFVACNTMACPDFFNGTVPGVAFSNGFLHINRSGSVELTPYSPSHKCRHGYDFEYTNGNISHPMLDRFFLEIFSDCSELERGMRTATIQEFLGAALLGLCPSMQKCLLLFGPGANGKSEVCKLAANMFPDWCRATIAPQRFESRFDIGVLVGKRLNLVTEMPETEILNSAAFKSVVTGDYTRAERKFQDPFGFTPEAGHMFMANSLPKTNDVSDGFFRRFTIVVFSRNMREAPCHRRNAAVDVIEAERPAIVRWAIDGAIRLLKNGAYTESPGGKQAMLEWKLEQNSVAGFVDEQCKRVPMGLKLPTGGTKATELYNKYREWGQNHGYKTVSSREFSRRLERLQVLKTRYSDGIYYGIEVGGKDE